MDSCDLLDADRVTATRPAAVGVVCAVNCAIRTAETVTDVCQRIVIEQLSTELNPCCHMGTAIKHPVPSLVTFDIWAL